MSIRKAIRAAAVVITMTVGTIVGTAGVAHADYWALSDGFELNPTTTWTLETYGQSAGGFELNAGTARSGRNNAWLRATTSFSAYGRNVRITPARYRPDCSASVYIQSPGGAALNFEIIDPATWNYIRLTSVTPASTGSGWTLVSSGVWHPGVEGGENVVVRVALLGDGYSNDWIRIDDLQVSCSGYLQFLTRAGNRPGSTGGSGPVLVTALSEPDYPSQHCAPMLSRRTQLEPPLASRATRKWTNLMSASHGPTLTSV